MSDDWRDTLREGLLESFKPRREEGAKCALCGAEHAVLSFHAVEYFQDDKEPLPTRFVPMSQTSYGTFGSIRGSFPICTVCAPPCVLCGLPRYSDKLVKYFRDLQLRFNERVDWGTGMCEHFHLSEFIKRRLGDETQLYVAEMKKTRNESQKSYGKMFNGMLGSK